MREILFRGKRKDGEWVYGNLLGWPDGETEILRHTYLTAEEKGYMEGTTVVPETVGEYTGLTDKNNTKIFEGDILATCTWDEDEYCILGIVRFGRGIMDSGVYHYQGYYLYNPTAEKGYETVSMESVRLDDDDVFVYGNIYDNPELRGDNGRRCEGCA